MDVNLANAEMNTATVKAATDANNLNHASQNTANSKIQLF
jgi:hypothetical protein